LIPATSGIFVITLSLPSRAPSSQVVTTAALLSAAVVEAAAVGVSAATSVDADAGGGIDGDGTGRRIQEHVIWDRKIDGGFPETKELKRRIRDLVEPGRGLGHVDRDHARKGKEVGMSVGTGGEEGMGRAQDLQGELVGGEAGNKQAREEKCEDCV